MRPIKIDYYELLGATRDADEDRIRSGFETAAQEVDTNTGDSSAQEERLGQLAEAYSALVTPSSRLLFDRYGYRSRGNPRIQEAIREARNIAERSDASGRAETGRSVVEVRPSKQATTPKATRVEPSKKLTVDGTEAEDHAPLEQMDWAALRYVSLALFLAAVGLLVAYIIGLV